MNPRSDPSPPVEKALLKAPSSPPLSVPPLGTISPDFDSRVDICLGGPLAFEPLSGAREGHYNFRGFVESTKTVSADCAIVKIQGPFSHHTSTKITFRDWYTGKSVYDAPLARGIDLPVGQTGLLCLFQNVRAVVQIEPRSDLSEKAVLELVNR